MWGGRQGRVWEEYESAAFALDDEYTGTTFKGEERCEKEVAGRGDGRTRLTPRVSTSKALGTRPISFLFACFQRDDDFGRVKRGLPGQSSPG